VFSLQELCVLLDIDHAGALSVFPEPAEVATFLGDSNPIQAGGEIVETGGLLRFRTGLLHLYRPPRALVRSTLWRCSIEIDDFAEHAIWKHPAEYTSSYLGDTMKQDARRDRRHGYRRYRGDGVIVDYAPTPPSGHDPDQRGWIELQITHDEPRLAAIRRVLRIADDVVLAGDPSCGTQVPSHWDLRMTVGVVDDEVRVRWSAPMRAGGAYANESARCAHWMSDLLTHLFDHGSGAGEKTTRWAAPTTAGQPPDIVTLLSVEDDRRHTGELRFPARW
jgi:hypothetical protein